MKMVLKPKERSELLISIQKRFQRIVAQLRTIKDKLKRKPLEDEIAQNEAVRKTLLEEDNV